MNKVHISKMTGKLQGLQAISTNTTTNKLCNKINKSNVRENLRRFKHDCEIGNKMIIKRDANDGIIKSMEHASEGQFQSPDTISSATPWNSEAEASVG